MGRLARTKEDRAFIYLSHQVLASISLAAQNKHAGAGRALAGHSLRSRAGHSPLPTTFCPLAPLSCLRCVDLPVPCGDPQFVRPTALSAEGPRHERVTLLRGLDLCETVLRTAVLWNAAQELLATVARGSAHTPTNRSASAPLRSGTSAL